MLKGLCLLLFIIQFISFSYSQERIYFIGHAYGDPAVKDHKMEPSVLSFLEDDFTKVIYGGDFIYDIGDELEIKNFIEFNQERDFVLIPGNHDVKWEPFKHQKNRFEIFKDNLFFYLNTNFAEIDEVKNSVEFIKKTIKKNNTKNILIFSHQLIYSKSNFDIRTNSRDNYKLANLFYDNIFTFLSNLNKKIYIYSGDIGAFKYTPHCYYDQIDNISFYSSGLGNGINNHLVEITIDKIDNITNLFIDLNTLNREDPEKYNRWKVRLYQFPKLILHQLRENYFYALPLLFLLLFKVFLLRKNNIV